MTLLLRYWPHLIVLALVFGAGVWVGSKPANERAAKAELALSFAQRDAAQQAQAKEAEYRKREQGWIAAYNDQAARYEQEKEDAQLAADRLLADLRTDNRRLRGHWQAALATSELSREAAAASFADGGADLRQRDIAAVRGIVGRCEAHVRSLQALVSLP